MTRAIVVLTVLCATAVAGQSPGPRTIAADVARDAAKPSSSPRLVTIRGRAVAGDNGMRLRRVRILVAVGPRVMAPVFTDDDGRFAVEIPETDSFVLTASKAGYAVAQSTIRPTAPRGTVQVRLSRGAAVSGRLTDTSGAPVADRRVSVRRVDAPRSHASARALDPMSLHALTMAARFSTATTDDRGEYRVGGLPAGDYEVSVAPSVFRSTTAGGGSLSFSVAGVRARLETPDPSADVTLDAGEESTLDFTVPAETSGSRTTRRVFALGGAMRLVMPPGADDARAVEGTIVDEHGEPMQGIGVQVLHLRRERGRMVAARLGPPRETDDRGRYRIFGLPPASYLVMATPDAGMSDLIERQTVPGYAPMFYPGTPHIDQALHVSLEQADASGVGLVLAPAALARVAGFALDADGEPLNGSIRLLPAAGSSPIVLESAPIRLDPPGSFVVRDVLPGRYVIQAQERGSGTPGEFGMAYVEVDDRDPPPVMIRTSPGVAFEGRFVAEGPDPLPAFAAAAVPIDPDRMPAGGGETRLVVSSSGSFYSLGMRGPMALTLRGAPDGWFIRSIRIAGTTASDGVFDFGEGPRTIADAEIVLSPRGASVVGRVIDGRSNAPSTRTAVVVFPAFRDQWSPHSTRMKSAVVGADGAFRIGGLPPGDYWVARLHGLDPDLDDWQSADVLEPLLSRAQRVTLEEGARQSLELR